jgi:hypothetical protein
MKKTMVEERRGEVVEETDKDPEVKSLIFHVVPVRVAFGESQLHTKKISFP